MGQFAPFCCMDQTGRTRRHEETCIRGSVRFRANCGAWTSTPVARLSSVYNPDERKSPATRGTPLRQLSEVPAVRRRGR